MDIQANEPLADGMLKDRPNGGVIVLSLLKKETHNYLINVSSTRQVKDITLLSSTFLVLDKLKPVFQQKAWLPYPDVSLKDNYLL